MLVVLRKVGAALKPGSRRGSPRLPQPLSGLEELSRNLWWSWDPEAVELWNALAERLGTAGGKGAPRNPVRLLRAASGAALARLAADRSFTLRLEEVLARFRKHLASRPSASAAPRLPGTVAYFSMEFGLHESLPIYAGGLGLLAGDHLKAASDLALPLIGVGLFYHRGYFRQGTDGRGRQTVAHPRVDLNALPLEPWLDAAGRPLSVEVELPGRVVKLRLLRVRVGRVELVLLDSDLPQNSPRDRTITDRLYIGDREVRITQEVVCGIGGVRALRALGVAPAAWHLNEGHVAFLSLERIRELTARGRFDFQEAAELVASDCVFTTHTPVAEGNEVFHLDLASRFLVPHCAAARVRVEDYLRLGLDRTADGRPVLSMTVLALRLSRFRNGVSKLHGEVARRMWQRLWPGMPLEKVPIDSVTNGVHTPSWTAPELHRLYRRTLGRRWTERLADPDLFKAARFDDAELWAIKRRLKERLIRFVRERMAREMVENGRSEAAAREAAEHLLDSEALTIGFARRFALYKRAGLLFRDLKRAARLFNDRRRPIQIIFAGKPHPEDRLGQSLFEEIGAIARRPEFAGRMVLLSNYDIEMAHHLVQGVDLWLNTPRRPLEASGTSGQKVPVNCGLNLSILDGWWCEGYRPGAGWAFGRPIDYPDPRKQDREDLADLYRVLEEEVVPLYFRRGRDGLPRGWLSMVKASLVHLVSRFSTATMVSEYARRLYLPAASSGRLLRAGGGQLARAVSRWRRRVELSWPLVHVVRAARSGGGRRGEVDLFVPGLGPGDLTAHLAVNGSRLSARPGRMVREGVLRFSFPLRDRSPVVFQVQPRHPHLPRPEEMTISLEMRI